MGLLEQLKNMKKEIPNLITLLNVFCGCVATIFAAMNRLELAAVFMFLGIIFDFLDGLAARLLNVKSDLGLQLDSLADVITSGVVPGIVMFQLLNMSMMGGCNMTPMEASAMGSSLSILPFFGFLITLGAAYRLARFNLDEGQKDSFIGLPTPANALLIISLPLILLYHNNDFLNGIILNQWFLIGLTLLSCYLMNSKIALFALKFKNGRFKDNAMQHIFLIVSLVLLITMKFLAMPIIIAFYIVSSILGKISNADYGPAAWLNHGL